MGAVKRLLEARAEETEREEVRPYVWCNPMWSRGRLPGAPCCDPDTQTAYTIHKVGCFYRTLRDARREEQAS